MTKISYIHGIKAEEMPQRAALLSERSFIDYPSMTDGEMYLTLLADRYKMLSEYYPEVKNYTRAKEMLVDALYKGVHSGQLAGKSTFLPGDLVPVAQAIGRARLRTAPAGKNIQLKGRTSINGGINDPLVPLADCEDLLEIASIITTPEGSEVIYTADSLEAQYQCILQNQYREILNEHLENSSHHMLYDFMSQVEANLSPGIVSTKWVLHRGGRNTLADTSDIKQYLIQEWMRNGIMRRNAEEGGGPASPEESIEALKEYPNRSFEEYYNPGIGGFFAILIPVLTALASAIGAAAALVQQIKQKDSQKAYMWDSIQGIGTPAFSADGPDWLLGSGTIPPPPGNQQPGEPFAGEQPPANQPPAENTLFGLDNNTLITLGLAGAGLLLLSNKK